MRPEAMTWIAIDDRGKTHHVTPEDVMGATVELLGEVRVLHEVIAKLHDHHDPEVRRLIRWACQQIEDGPKLPAPPEIGRELDRNTPTSPRRPPRVLVVAFGLSALLGLITAANLLISWMGSL
ncbi:MAG: hypothetical protein CMH39_00240 [Micrococcales bacterium]|nr:hypothetical protein [Micrococcales bacterium]